MSDELEQIRALRGDPPPPSEDWASETRAELLAMADEERRQRTAPTARPRWRDRLAALLRGRRPLALAGAVTLAVVVAVGAVLLTPDPQESTAPMAEPTRSPTATPTSPATPATPSTPPEGEVVLASSCEGGDGTYTIDYPEGWHTNAGDVAAPCERFDDEPIELEAGVGGAPEHPVVVEVVPLALADVAEPGQAVVETSRTTKTVDGLDAVVVQWTSSGEAALPEGMRSYRYLVDLDGERTLVVAANDLGGHTWDELRDVVDAMVGSLELTPG